MTTQEELILRLQAGDAEQARQMTGLQKFRAGGDLFDEACRWTMAGIRAQHPEYSAAEVMDELRRRIARGQAYQDGTMNSADIVLHVVSLFEKLAIPYMVVGSYASNYYGRPRSTADADFVVAMEDKQVERFMQEMGGDFRLESQMAFEALTMTQYLAIVHPKTAFRIELFTLGDDPHHQAEFGRRRRANLGGKSAWLSAPEDVIIQKLRWARSPNRTQDLGDAANIVIAQGAALDLNYLRQWADAHGTREMLEHLLAGK